MFCCEKIFVSNIIIKKKKSVFYTKIFFKSVSLDAGSPVWGEIIDLSPRMLYMRLTGCSSSDIDPSDGGEAIRKLQKRIRKQSEYK